MDPAGPPVRFLNLEYFFQLLYQFFFGGGGESISTNAPAGPSFDSAGTLELASRIWFGFSVVSYLFSLAAIGVIVYCMMRIWQIREDEKVKYATVQREELHEELETSRWMYIQELMKRGHESDWRQAIIESDVILDELLTRLGYPGESVGEKLRAVDRSRFRTLDQAWEAHKVRNEIAHQGSAFQLSEQLALRTIANFEAVFREHEEL